MLNKENYFITNNTGSPVITATVTIQKNLSQSTESITYSSVGQEYKNIFSNNIAALRGLINAISSDTKGVYFSSNEDHVRKDVHYNG